MKTIVKILGYAIIGFIFGYIGASYDFWLPNILSFITSYSTAISITFLIIIGALTAYGFIYSKLTFNKLPNQSTDDLTDEQDQKRYIALTDITLISHIAFYLSIFYIAYTVVIQDQLLFMLLSLAAIVLSYTFLIYSFESGRKVYSERSLPSLGSNKFDQQLFDVMDDGEKHIAFLGMHKAFTFLQSGIIFSILLCIGYSYVSDESQMFSIIIMCLLAAITQTVYAVSIRKYA